MSLKALKKIPAPKPTDGNNSGIRPKSRYKNLCHSLTIDKYVSEKKKKSAIEYDLDGVEVVPVISTVFSFGNQYCV